MSKKILLLGSTGLLGSEFKKFFFDDVEFDLKCFNRSDFDVLNDSFELFIDIVNEFKPDYIINCLAFTNTSKAEEIEFANDCFAINAFFPIKLSQYCEEKDIRIIHFSSDFVFGGYDKEYFNENDPVSPLNNYGFSKALLENFITNKDYNNSAIFRTSWLFGGNKSNFVLNITKLMKEKGELSVVDDQIVCLTYTDMVIKSVALFLNDFKKGIYNCVADEPLTLYEIAFIAIKCKLGVKYTDKLKRASLDEYESNVRRPKKVILKNNKLPKLGKIKEKIEEYISNIEL